jgi:hypothetical protein
MACARTWRWVPVFPIRRSSRTPSQSRLRDIVAENRMLSEPNQSLVDYIMNIRSPLLTRERFLADDNAARCRGNVAGIFQFD